MTHPARQVIESDYTLQKILAYLKHDIPFDIPERLIIDEVSMLTVNQFEYLSTGLIKRTGVNRPFGGIGVLLFGHLAQLTGPDPKSLPFHKSKLYKLFTPVKLTKNYRHDKDPQFRSILTKIENYYNIGGNDKSKHYAFKVLKTILTKDEMKALNARQADHPNHDDESPNRILQYSNKNVNASNNTMLDHKPLKVGDMIVMRVNLKNKNMWNGDRYPIQKVQTATYTINGHNFSKTKTTIKGSVSNKFADIQYTAASTIHCSQGQTTPVWVNIGGITMNLLYVALSRAKCLGDVQISKAFK